MRARILLLVAAAYGDVRLLARRYDSPACRAALKRSLAPSGTFTDSYWSKASPVWIFQDGALFNGSVLCERRAVTFLGCAFLFATGRSHVEKLASFLDARRGRPLETRDAPRNAPLGTSATKKSAPRCS